jgi:hypothetical protein
VRRVFLALFAAPALWAQTPVSVLVPNTTLHDHYLFNRSYKYDGQDYTGLPWMFYYVNVGSSPAPTTLRTRCPMQQVNGTPYNRANFGWFRFPVPGGNWIWPPSNGTEPLAATGEYLETAQFGPMGSTNPVGFVFDGEFAGETDPPSSHTPGQPPHYFVETVYFTDRECSDAGTEYGWYRLVADSDSGDAPPNSFTFYYSKFSNCNQDYGCWDTNGHQVQSSVATATTSSVAPTAAGTYQYKYQVIRSGSSFNVSILDPSSGSPVTCQWSISTGGGSGPCQFSVPIESWYPSASQIDSGYVVVATQSSHLYPATTGAPYPQWYDYAPGGVGAAPPTNVVPTNEPNGTRSCITHGVGYACLDALSLQVLYE